MNSSLNFKEKEYDKMSHIESFVKDDKTIAQYKPHIWSDKQYITFRLKSNKKKGKYYEPVFKSKNLDAALFIYNNLHIIDVMSMNRKKDLLTFNVNNNENTKKVLFLDADFEDQKTEKLTIAKGKELKVNVIPVVYDDEICME